MRYAAVVRHVSNLATSATSSTRPPSVKLSLSPTGTRQRAKPDRVSCAVVSNGTLGPATGRRAVAKVAAAACWTFAP